LKLNSLNNFHNYILQIIKSVEEIDVKLSLLKSLANFNFQIHTGRFYCDKIECELIEIGEKYVDKINNERFVNHKSVLHVATEFYPTGGHTRLFEKYVEVFGDFQNHLMLTNQQINDIPLRIQANLKVKIIESDLDFLGCAINLASIWDQFDHVILHVHPDDIVPTLAYGICPIDNITFINHADHLFWVGKSIISRCVSIRPLAVDLCTKYRKISNNLLIPIIVDTQKIDLRKVENNYQNGYKVVFGSMSSLNKVIPNGKKNFIKDIYELLDIYPKSEFLFIGLTIKDLKLFGYEQNLNPRLKLLGEIENPADYLRLIDIYLEGYPYNSLTAVYESIIFGACPVLMYDVEDINCHMESDKVFSGLLFHSENKNVYFDNINKLVHNKKFRNKITLLLQSRVIQNCSVNNARKILLNDSEPTLILTNVNINNWSKDLLNYNLNNFRFSQKKNIDTFSFFNINTYVKLSFVNKLKLHISFFYINMSFKSFFLELYRLFRFSKIFSLR
jgi:hypothetical protein